MTDRKEYIHLINTSIHYKTINKITIKNGLGAIKPRQRPNRTPTIKYPMHTFSQPYIHTSNCPPIRHLTTTSYHPSQEYILTLHNNKQNSDKIGLRAIKPRQRPNRSPANYLLNHQVISSPSIDPSIQPLVHSCAAACIRHASESITCFRRSAECHRRPPQRHRK